MHSVVARLRQEPSMTSKFVKYAGLAASLLLIAFGIGAIATGVASRGTVHDTLAREHITGTDDMTPAGIAAAVKGTKLASFALPTCSVAGKPVDNGGSARCFADYMRIHALEATGGRTYSQMGQYLTAAGKETSDKTQAAKDPKTGQPTPNGARDVWVTETALSTALNTSYFAESVGLFALIMGIALLLTGIGFLVVVVRWMREPAASAQPVAPTAPIAPVPA
jgi:F0F1-type ATP synthase membrane subunit c/vacuolar-type H+-ATPase subunit K